MKFVERLKAVSHRNKSWLCIGLDPDPVKMPPVKVLDFNRAIISATSDLVCAYKPNLAFYEALGLEGLRMLEKTIEAIPGGIPVIADAKRNDIGNTSRAYAKAILRTFNFDAVTVNPYLGYDSLEPFFEYHDKGIFVLCRTSNPGAKDFQDVTDTSGRRLFEIVAQKASEWNKQRNIGLVVGATYPEEMSGIRKICPEMPFLIPGVGSQGGDLEAAVTNGISPNGDMALINISRQILYASIEDDYGKAARKAASEYKTAINKAIESGKGQG